jgi:catechol 2,3-dioxygenase-like lactoylglutathione lyase family enzyme
VKGESSPDLGLGTPYHIGIAVYEIEKAIERYGKAFGIRNWRLQEVAEGASVWQWHGEPKRSPGMKFAYSVTELPLLEFIEPTGSAESSVAKHLREHGEGVFHLGYFVDNIPELLERAARLEIPAEAVAADAQIAYLDPVGAHGLRVELVSSDLRAPLLQWALSR